MKRNLKKTMILAATVVATVATTTTSFAAGWKQDNVGWWYERANGSYPTNQWEWVDGNNDGVAECYYFNNAGYCLLNTITPDGYTVNTDGAWTVNNVIQTQAATVASTANTVTTQTLPNTVFSENGVSFGKLTGVAITDENILKAYDMMPERSKQLGWVEVNDDWFYVYPGTRTIAKNTTIEGYKLGANGAMLTESYIDLYLHDYDFHDLYFRVGVKEEQHLWMVDEMAIDECAVYTPNYVIELEYDRSVADIEYYCWVEDGSASNNMTYGVRGKFKQHAPNAKVVQRPWSIPGVGRCVDTITEIPVTYVVRHPGTKDTRLTGILTFITSEYIDTDRDMSGVSQVNTQVSSDAHTVSRADFGADYSSKSIEENAKRVAHEIYYWKRYNGWNTTYEEVYAEVLYDFTYRENILNNNVVKGWGFNAQGDGAMAYLGVKLNMKEIYTKR